ncbi:ATP-binding protein [Alkalimarinus alittae]|uniref:histidine kinase n=1 Tax=Alkalimarinus alittae TaxID=2961619 RepID=A0ABY6N2Q9_9ALTE|nr:ATP-binding protein [Alkalimarinus alittae]UZE96395.1 ATP-binding protein [Alkalimarinus alittae]
MTQKMQRKLSLKSFLTLHFLLVSLIPIALVLMLAGVFLFPHLSKKETLDQEALAQAITSRIEIQLESAKRELQRFSKLLPILDNESHVQQFLDNIADISDVYEAVYIVNSDGLVTHVGLPALYQPYRDNYVGLDMSRKPFIIESRKTQQERFYGTFLSAVSGHLSAGYLIPMGEKMLVAEVSVDQLPELSAFLSKESGQTIMILDREGHLLVHPDSRFEHQQLNLSHIPLIKKGLEQNGASGAFSFQGIEYFGTVVLTGKTGWIVVVSKTLKQYQDTLFASGLILFASLLVGMVVAVIIAQVIGGVFSRRFRLFMRLAEAITSGHYDAKPAPSKIKEIEILGHEILNAGQQIKNREQALVVKEQRYRALVEQSPVGVIEWAPDLEIVGWNRVAQSILGFLDKGVISSAVDYLAQEENEQKLASLAIRFASEASFVAEHQFKSSAGENIICRSFNTSIIDDDGDLLGYLSLVEDITEQRRTQEEIQGLNAQLEQRVTDRTVALSNTNEQLKHALKNLKRTQSELLRADKLAALGAMVAGVSHELNTPIGNAVMAITTLEKQTHIFEAKYQAGDIKRSTFEDYLAISKESEQLVAKNLFRAAELITSFKQVAVDQTSAQKRVFELRQHIAEVLLTLQPQFKKSTVTLKSNVPMGIELNSFPGPLGQVITNLVNNALIHGFEKGERGVISISAEKLADDTVRIIVEDNGKGIPEENLEKVFDPFFSTRLGDGGTGLGLHIVHNIVTDVLAGSMALTSTEGGAQFTVIIPLAV